VHCYDIFNGDADGICALHQLRLALPRDSELVTGVKREIDLVARVQAGAGDVLTVLDLSLAANRKAVLDALAAGARCQYFDHHVAGDIPVHPALEVHIDPTPGTCTSLIVNDYLGARFRLWAVVGAFGDNLPQRAEPMAQALELTPVQTAQLRELGECLNYNAYGDTTQDLHFHPAELYRRLQPYADPREFAVRDAAFEVLRRGYREDLAQAASIAPVLDAPTHQIIVLPDAAWARRVHGALANRLVRADPLRAHAVLVTRGASYRVSVRAPAGAPAGAAELCARFPTGGGRSAAAGISALPLSEFAAFRRAFEASFAASVTGP